MFGTLLLLHKNGLSAPPPLLHATTLPQADKQNGAEKGREFRKRWAALVRVWGRGVPCRSRNALQAI